MKKILLFGLGRNFKVIVNEILKISSYNIIGFIDENINDKFVIIEKKKIFNRNKDQKKLINKKDTKGLITFGDNFLRKQIFSRVHKINKNFKWEKLISKQSFISKNVVVEQGSIVMPGVIINSYSRIGQICLINTGSIIEHDNYFKNFSSAGPGVTTSGNVIVNELSHLGTGSVVIHDITIGKNTILGANSVAIKNLDSDSVYVGNPAKKIKKRKKGSKYL